MVRSKESRRVRPTLRCLTDDFELPIPPLSVDLSDTDHVLMVEARRVAPTSPTGQKRILSIAHPLVYRLRHSRWRGATWAEPKTDRFWVLGGAFREEGDDDDAYEYFKGLHDAGKLLPTDDDDLRDRAERASRLLREAQQTASETIGQARAQMGTNVEVVLDGRVDLRLHAPSPDELWIAISIKTRTGEFIDEKVRDTLFAVFLEAARAVDVEERRDWPNEGLLPWFEVARVALTD